ncbi:MAG: tRNA (guanosine(37)-N1)-methyltransferase TrmD [Phycisphaerae bacterium]|jgi:tRNA (guanine37-N1)-methyltransferase|nr:tRNA (guanosine(37)-N1)-methyltransferase TrmD [Phycisphaerae bacterium]
MRIDVLTLFPDMFPQVLGTSIVGRAAQNGIVSYHVHDIRAWADNRHNKVDDRPFGGGPGMVMMCQPVFDSVCAVEAMDPRPAVRLLMTPQGEPLRQSRVEWLARQERLLLIAGHYEGIDERVIEELQPLEISIGDFVLSGGELPAMLVLDAVVRLQPGALGHEGSAAEDSFASGPTGPCGTPLGPRLLDCPHFTRPREWRGRPVPDVLLSGDHGSIAKWRDMQRLERTRLRRPDLLDSDPKPTNTPPTFH